MQCPAGAGISQYDLKAATPWHRMHALGLSGASCSAGSGPVVGPAPAHHSRPTPSCPAGVGVHCCQAQLRHCAAQQGRQRRQQQQAGVTGAAAGGSQAVPLGAPVSGCSFRVAGRTDASRGLAAAASCARKRVCMRIAEPDVTLLLVGGGTGAACVEELRWSEETNNGDAGSIPL